MEVGWSQLTVWLLIKFAYLPPLNASFDPNPQNKKPGYFSTTENSFFFLVTSQSILKLSHIRYRTSHLCHFCREIVWHVFLLTQVQYRIFHFKAALYRDHGTPTAVQGSLLPGMWTGAVLEPTTNSWELALFVFHCLIPGVWISKALSSLLRKILKIFGVHTIIFFWWNFMLHVHIYIYISFKKGRIQVLGKPLRTIPAPPIELHLS